MDVPGHALMQTYLEIVYSKWKTHLLHWSLIVKSKHTWKRYWTSEESEPPNKNVEAMPFCWLSVRPSIDQGAAGSKSVKVNRSAIWHIKCKGEPPPKFSWYKDGELLENGDDIKIETKEYQGGATALMQIVKSKMSDAGVYNFITQRGRKFKCFWLNRACHITSSKTSKTEVFQMPSAMD